MNKEYDCVRLYPIFNRAMTYTEHFAGNLVELGDALGRDCNIVAFEIGSSQTVGLLKPYKNNGKRNEDWYSYEAEVLSPTKGIVKEIYNNNEKENSPGNFIPNRASSILIEREDGIKIYIAHIKNILVSVGDKVNEGDVIAHCGNNGCSRAPHIHVGAWKDEPLQVEFDLYKMGKIVEKVGETYYFTGYTEQEIEEMMKL